MLSLLFSPLVILPIGARGVDVMLLALLDATAEQNNQPLAIPAE
jgi:hypothetical protein